MLAADCLKVGLFCKAICCSSSSVIVFCSEAGVCARPGKATRNKAQEKQSRNRVTQLSGDTISTLSSTNFTSLVRLFMFVFHPRRPSSLAYCCLAFFYAPCFGYTWLAAAGVQT